MTALERIKELEDFVNQDSEFKDFTIDLHGEEILLILKAFRVMREIALSEQQEFFRLYPESHLIKMTIDELFEERMKE